MAHVIIALESCTNNVLWSSSLLLQACQSGSCEEVLYDGDDVADGKNYTTALILTLKISEMQENKTVLLQLVKGFAKKYTGNDEGY